MNKEVSNSMEQFLLASNLTRILGLEFQSALRACAPNQFIPKPDSLDKAKKSQRQNLKAIRSLRQLQNRGYIEMTNQFLNLSLEKLKALDLAAKAIFVRSKLETTGGTYGDKAINFCLDSVKLPIETISQIKDTALQGLRTLKDCQPDRSLTSPTDSFLLAQNIPPNGARVDIILTAAGPAIIEINTLWVDGFPYLDSMQKVFTGNNSISAAATLADFFPNCSRLGIVFLNPATGSRALGEQPGLDYMARQLLQRNIFTSIEIIDPEKFRPEYISSFPNLYVNGDPRMLQTGDTPDWLTKIYSSNFRPKIFPIWNPGYESKQVLIEASKIRPDIFAETLAFSDINISPDWIIKGNSFSSRQVASPSDPMFENILADAAQFPNDYVIQEKLASIPLAPTWVFNTSDNKPYLLKKPFSKFNVWIVENRIAGISVSISDSQIISDKDYNTIPIPI